MSGVQERLLPGHDPDDIVAEAKDNLSPAATFCMFSGGNDSGVLAHRCRQHYDALFYIDTGLALPSTEVAGHKILGVEDFVRLYAEWIGKPLVVKRSGDVFRTIVLGNDLWWERYKSEAKGLSIEEFVKRDKRLHGQSAGVVRSTGENLGRFPWGFPGARGHGITYSLLKERRIRDVVRDVKAAHSSSAQVLFLSGVRRAESEQRKKMAEPITTRGGVRYANALLDWTNAEMRAYREEHEVPESDVADLLHRSGECNCAAKGDWWQERDWIQSIWPNWFEEKIASVEREAEARGIRWCRWGGFDLDGIRAGRDSNLTVGPLCDDCERQLSLGAS